MLNYARSPRNYSECNSGGQPKQGIDAAQAHPAPTSGIAMGKVNQVAHPNRPLLKAGLE